MVAVVLNRRHTRVAPSFAHACQRFEPMFVAASESHRFGGLRIDARETGTGPGKLQPPDAMLIASPDGQLVAAAAIADHDGSVLERRAVEGRGGMGLVVIDV